MNAHDSRVFIGDREIRKGVVSAKLAVKSSYLSPVTPSEAVYDFIGGVILEIICVRGGQ